MLYIIKCKQDTESVLSNRGNLEGTHLTRFSPRGVILGGYLRTPQKLTPMCNSVLHSVTHSDKQPTVSVTAHGPICEIC